MTVRPADLPSVQELAIGKPHGHKMRYVAGCRCWRCKRGNRQYENKIRENRRLYGPNDVVPVDAVRDFLEAMQHIGIGYITIARHVGVGKTALGEILWAGRSIRKHIRRRTEAKVLSYRPTLDTMPLNLKVPGQETLGKLCQLIRWGYPKALINRDGLGHENSGLQVARGKSPWVTVKTAIKIRDFYAAVEAIRTLWLKHHELPRRHYVYWKNGRRRMRLEDLELRSVIPAYSYHYLYPPGLKSTIKLSNRLKRTYREKLRNEKHD
jgi:hypothetical protein